MPGRWRGWLRRRHRFSVERLVVEQDPAPGITGLTEHVRIDPRLVTRTQDIDVLELAPAFRDSRFEHATRIVFATGSSIIVREDARELQQHLGRPTRTRLR